MSLALIPGIFQDVRLSPFTGFFGQSFSGVPLDLALASWLSQTFKEAASLSNSEIFCHAIKSTSRAPLVGKATAGGVISAVNTSIPDVGVLQIPFRGWYREKDGLNYDLGGAVPDFDIDLTPAVEDSEQDPQLKKALEILNQKL